MKYVSNPMFRTPIWGEFGKAGWVGLLVAFVALSWAPTAMGGECLWQVSTGDWSVASNWSPAIPGTSDTAIIDNNGVAEITSDIGHVDQANVANTNSGGIIHTSGTATFGILYLASLPGSIGSYQLSPAGQITTNYLNVALGGVAEFTQTGGVVQAYSNVNVGVEVGSHGTVHLYEDALLSVPQCALGTWGIGELYQHGGRVDLNGYLILGWGGTGDGTYTLEAGQLTMLTGTGYNNVEIGTRGSGRFIQLGGTHTVNGNLIIGFYPTGDGVYECHGGQLYAERVRVGIDGAGELGVFGPDSVISFGQYEQSASGILSSVIDADGVSTIMVSTTASLDGAWIVTSENAPLGRFDVLTAQGGLSGQFDNVVLPGPDWSLGIDSGETLFVLHVPEPATLSLLAAGIGAVWLKRRRKA